MRSVAFVLFSALALAQTPEQIRLSQQGKQLMGAGRFNEAVPVYEQLVKSAPGNPGLKLNLGIALHMAKRDAEAVAQLEPVTKELPSAFPAWALLGASYMRLGQPARAVAPLERAVQMNPNDPQGRRILADALLMLERYSAALAHLEQLTQMTPREPAVWFGLVRVYEELSRQRFEHLRKTAPESAPMLYLLAETRQKQGRRAAATALFEQARKLSPKPPVCPAPNSPYCNIQRYDAQARAALTKLAELGDSVEWRQSKAELLRGQNKHPEAIAEWRAALKMAPGRPDLEQQLASSLYSAQRYEEAESLLRKLLNRDPGNAELHYLLGDSLLQRGNTAEALVSLRRAHKLAPVVVPIRATLGRALAAEGKMAEAIPHLEAAAPYDEDGALHFQLSRAYTSAGQPARAAAAAKKSQELRQ